MKKLFLFIILLSVYSFGQENRTVRQNDLADTLNANSRGWITGDAIADSNFVKTSETLNWDKTGSDDLSEAAFDDSLNANFFVGTDSIHYGEDSIVVTHGVGSTPSFVSIQLVSDGFGFQTWVSGINSLTFYVRRSDTGLKTISNSIQFKWMAKK